MTITSDAFVLAKRIFAEDFPNSDSMDDVEAACWTAAAAHLGNGDVADGVDHDDYDDLGKHLIHRFIAGMSA